MVSVHYEALFAGGPPEKVERWIGLEQAEHAKIGRRILLFILLGWVPLLDLALVQNSVGEAGAISFAQDFAVHARMLIAIPLLIAAEGVCATRLSAIANRLLSSGLVREGDAQRYADIRWSIIKQRDSTVAEITIVVLSYLLMWLGLSITPLALYPAWQVTQSEYLFHHSLAGWWHLLVSLPMLFILILGWLWRIFLWARFLHEVSKLDLRLNAAHPDGAAGLGFVGLSVQAFWMVGLALGFILAGTAANFTVYRGWTIQSLAPAIAILAVVTLVLFCGPLLALSQKLVRVWRDGIHSYGALARDLGEQFELKWFDPDKRVHPEALDVGDFSATTDLYSIAANVYRMRVVPMTLSSVIIVEVATLAPFLIAAALSMPLDELLKKIAGFLM